MTIWKSRGLRGSDLEELIELTLKFYKSENLACIDKIATPIKTVEISETGVITKGFFEKKSTVDFIGLIQGMGVAFDAKETNLKSFPFSNIHPHQLEYMDAFVKQGGLAFFIIYFKQYDTFHLLPYETLKVLYENSNKKGSRKSIPYKSLDSELQIYRFGNQYLDFIPTLNKYYNKFRT